MLGLQGEHMFFMMFIGIVTRIVFCIGVVIWKIIQTLK